MYGEVIREVLVWCTFLATQLKVSESCPILSSSALWPSFNQFPILLILVLQFCPLQTLLPIISYPLTHVRIVSLA